MVEWLEKAAADLRDYHSTSDRLVLDLLRFIEGISLLVLNSFLQKLCMHQEMKGMILRFRMPAFWFTLNPSDLRYPLVMSLAGMQEGDHINPRLQIQTATMNPVTVAQFFYYICTAF